jgi:DNA-binding TFAR19-related protein (PDSD5 family)
VKKVPDDEQLEKIRMQKAQKAYGEARERAMKEEQIRSAIAQVLEPEAYSRLMFVRQNNPQLFAQAVQAIAYLQQRRQLAGRISEKQLVQLLAKIAGPRNEGSITFKRKGEE